MKRVIIIAVALIACFNLYSQNQTDSIQVVKKLATVFQQNGKTLNIAQIESITSVNTQAAKEMKIAKSNYTFSTIFGGIGAGIALLAIPVSLSSAKHTKNAVQIYNKGLQHSSLPNREVRFGSTQNGVGVRITF